MQKYVALLAISIILRNEKVLRTFPQQQFSGRGDVGGGGMQVSGRQLSLRVK